MPVPILTRITFPHYHCTPPEPISILSAPPARRQASQLSKPKHLSACTSARHQAAALYTRPVRRYRSHAPLCSWRASQLPSQRLCSSARGTAAARACTVVVASASTAAAVVVAVALIRWRPLRFHSTDSMGWHKRSCSQLSCFHPPPFATAHPSAASCPLLYSPTPHSWDTRSSPRRPGHHVECGTTFAAFFCSCSSPWWRGGSRAATVERSGLAYAR